MATPKGTWNPGQELWTGNTVVTGAQPGLPGIHVYVGNSGSEAIPVVIVSGSGGGGGSIPQPTTGTNASFSYHSASSRLILAPNTSRRSFKIYNDTETNYIMTFGFTASLNQITTVIPPQWTYEDDFPGWQGPVAGIGVGGGSGTIYYTEMV
jgi:hypothetical protein